MWNFWITLHLNSLEYFFYIFFRIYSDLKIDRSTTILFEAQRMCCNHFYENIQQYRGEYVHVYLDYLNPDPFLTRSCMLQIPLQLITHQT